MRLENTEKQIESVRVSAATVDQLHNSSALMKAAIDATEKTITLKLENLAADLAPIKRGVYWAVTLIIGGVLMALMTLLLNGNPPKLTP